MSGEAIISVTGNVGSDPEIRFLPDGKAVASFSVANTPSKFNKQTQEWQDGETIWFRVSVFDKRGEGVAEQVRKGMRVIVSGVLTKHSYVKKDGTSAESLEIAANEVGVVPKGSPATRPQSGGDDPWAN